MRYPIKGLIVDLAGRFLDGRFVTPVTLAVTVKETGAAAEIYATEDAVVQEAGGLATVAADGTFGFWLDGDRYPRITFFNLVLTMGEPGAVGTITKTFSAVAGPATLRLVVDD